eukprot:CAMPEP_0205927970 /NCGR_PEP_ID=MMETSP1325-20131115/23778_1 /ASSEMBLY_ACC=CAM_ASM_000708 /TAXON_ID=236786 /ORGANISM="Florenciella sp., Strain RCC1007" /LENGTH=71 /DNA_ID=CAMNT_0053296927 /DNA_START=16 /DNA_END=228 /DNA_ORIENTATION=-
MHAAQTDVSSRADELARMVDHVEYGRQRLGRRDGAAGHGTIFARGCLPIRKNEEALGAVGAQRIATARGMA